MKQTFREESRFILFEATSRLYRRASRLCQHGNKFLLKNEQQHVVHTLWRSWAIPHLFERLFLITWENNRDCHITMPLSLKTMEVQIKGDQWNKRFKTVQVYWTWSCRSCWPRGFGALNPSISSRLSGFQFSLLLLRSKQLTTLWQRAAETYPIS